jgi:hypothetical protein
MRIALLVAIALLGACASVKKVEPGGVNVGERMTLHIPNAWNHLDLPAYSMREAQVWTTEGLGVDELVVYTGLRDGQVIHAGATPAGQKPLAFKSTMTSEEVIALLEGLMTRDGSTFKLNKVTPQTLSGRKGFRVDFERIRKSDQLRMQGMAFGVVDKGELFALIYQAPRLAFFDRQKANVEHIAASMKLK